MKINSKFEGTVLTNLEYIKEQLDEHTKKIENISSVMNNGRINNAVFKWVMGALIGWNSFLTYIIVYKII